MNNNVKKFSAVMAGMMLFSTLAACSSSASKSYDPEPLKQYVEGQTFSDTVFDLVESGTTDYVVVYPDGMDSNTEVGVKALVNYFEMATGIKLKTYTDSNFVEKADSKFISVGETTLLKEANIDLASYDLGASGYIIKTINDDVYLAGNKYGSQYACYEFLAHEFNFEPFTVDEIRLETNVKDKKLKDFNMIDIPAFEYRMAGNGEEYRNSMDVFRMHSFGDVYAGSYNEGPPPVHNYMEFIPKSKYYAEHPEWYSTDGIQLCFTRDPEGLLEAVTYEVTEFLKKWPTHKIVTFTQEDGGAWCSHCGELYEELTGNQAGGNTGGVIPGEDGAQIADAETQYYTLTVIKFVNELAKNVEAWRAKNYPERDKITVAMFHYGKTCRPPVKTDLNGNPILDENGNYIRIDESIEMADNFGVYYCYSFQTTYDGNLHETYYQQKDYMDKWTQAYGATMTLWGYTTNFQNYLVPFDGVSQMEANVDLCRGSGAQVFYIMSQYNMSTPVDWGHLESYVTSKLSWNPDLDVAKLVNDFFDNYYKSASGIMKEIYNDYITHLAWISSENGVNSKVNGQVAMMTTKNWPYNRLKAFLNKFDEAFAIIKPLSVTNPDLYKTLYDRINLETITFRYMLYKQYPEYFDYNQLESLKADMISDALGLGVMYCAEWPTTSMSDAFTL